MLLHSDIYWLSGFTRHAMPSRDSKWSSIGITPKVLNAQVSPLYNLLPLHLQNLASQPHFAPLGLASASPSALTNTLDRPSPE